MDLKDKGLMDSLDRMVEDQMVFQNKVMEMDSKDSKADLEWANNLFVKIQNNASKHVQ